MSMLNLLQAKLRNNYKINDIYIYIYINYAD